MRILSFSGGKDSTYLLCNADKLNIDKVVFADTGLELPCVYEWLDYMEKITGYEIERLKPTKTFNELFFRDKKGKNPSIRGFPPHLGAGCWIRRDLKLDPMQKYPDATWILGLCKGEEKRMQEGFEYPLIEWGITEKDVIKWLKKCGMYPPLYQLLEQYGGKKPRSGCWLCPKSNLAWCRLLYFEYPKLWEQLEELESKCTHGWKCDKTINDLANRFDNSVYSNEQQKLEERK